MNTPGSQLATVFILLFALSLPACAERGAESRSQDQEQISATLDSVQAQLSQQMQRIDARITELRSEAEDAAAEAGEGVAEQYGARANHLQEEKDRIRDRWERLRENAAENWDEVHGSLDQLLADARSLVDTLQAGGTGS